MLHFSVRKCQSCNIEVEWEQIAKGYEFEKGKFVLIEKDELDAIVPDSNKELRVHCFVPRGEISSVYYQKTYLVSPDVVGGNGYQLLLQAMENTNTEAVCSVTMRSKNYLATIKVDNGYLTMTTMHYPDEVRSTDSLVSQQNGLVDEKSLELAEMLIQIMTKRFTPSDFSNEKRDLLIALIQSKISGSEFVIQKFVAQPSIINLMEALQASLDQLKKIKPSKPKISSKSKSKTNRNTTQKASDAKGTETA